MSVRSTRQSKKSHSSQISITNEKKKFKNAKTMQSFDSDSELSVSPSKDIAVKKKLKKVKYLPLLNENSHNISGSSQDMNPKKRQKKKSVDGQVMRRIIVGKRKLKPNNTSTEISLNSELTNERNTSQDAEVQRKKKRKRLVKQKKVTESIDEYASAQSNLSSFNDENVAIDPLDSITSEKTFSNNKFNFDLSKIKKERLSTPFKLRSNSSIPGIASLETSTQGLSFEPKNDIATKVSMEFTIDSPWKDHTHKKNTTPINIVERRSTYDLDETINNVDYLIAQSPDKDLKEKKRSTFKKSPLMFLNNEVKKGKSPDDLRQKKNTTIEKSSSMFLNNEDKKRKSPDDLKQKKKTTIEKSSSMFLNNEDKKGKSPYDLKQKKRTTFEKSPSMFLDNEDKKGKSPDDLKQKKRTTFEKSPLMFLDNEDKKGKSPDDLKQKKRTTFEKSPSIFVNTEENNSNDKKESTIEIVKPVNNTYEIEKSINDKKENTFEIVKPVNNTYEIEKSINDKKASTFEIVKSIKRENTFEIVKSPENIKKRGTYELINSPASNNKKKNLRKKTIYFAEDKKEIKRRTYELDEPILLDNKRKASIFDKSNEIELGNPAKHRSKNITSVGVNLFDVTSPWCEEENNQTDDDKVQVFPDTLVMQRLKIVATPPSGTSTPFAANTMKKSILKKSIILKHSKSESCIKGTQNKTISKTPVRTKMPNYALIHKAAFDKMENLEQLVERKAERAKFLLSGSKPPISHKKFSSSKSESMIDVGQSKKQLRFGAVTTPKKSIDLVDESKKHNSIKLRVQTPKRLKSLNETQDTSNVIRTRENIALKKLPEFEAEKNTPMIQINKSSVQIKHQTNLTPKKGPANNTTLKIKLQTPKKTSANTTAAIKSPLKIKLQTPKKLPAKTTPKKMHAKVKSPSTLKTPNNTSSKVKSPLKNTLKTPKNMSAKIKSPVQNKLKTPKTMSAKVKSPLKSKLKTPKKVVLGAGYSRFGFKSLNTNATDADVVKPKKVLTKGKKEDNIKAVATKSHVVKNVVDTRRNVIKGVRSNRRFDLLMNMRSQEQHNEKF